MQTTHSNEANRKTGLAPEFIVPGNETTPPYLIKVIGVGGGGGNAVRHMAQQGIKDVEFILCNTDRQVLDSEDGLLLLQLGATGLGTGGDPQKGKEAAEESIEQIRPSSRCPKSVRCSKRPVRRCSSLPPAWAAERAPGLLPLWPVWPKRWAC